MFRFFFSLTVILLVVAGCALKTLFHREPDIHPAERLVLSMQKNGVDLVESRENIYAIGVGTASNLLKATELAEDQASFRIRVYLTERFGVLLSGFEKDAKVDWRKMETIKNGWFRVIVLMSAVKPKNQAEPEPEVWMNFVAGRQFTSHLL